MQDNYSRKVDGELDVAYQLILNDHIYTPKKTLTHLNISNISEAHP